MYLSRIVNGSISRYVDVSFFFRFLVLMVGLYQINMLCIHLIDPQHELYNAFFDHHLNYFSPLRASILHASNFLAHCFGLNSYVGEKHDLRIYGGHGIFVELPCLGYGLMIFWFAFTVAQKSRWKSKLLWCISGVIFLWLLNCCRVTLLLVAVNKSWKINKWMDHHALYNMVVYLMIIGMVYLYYISRKREEKWSVSLR